MKTILAMLGVVGALFVIGCDEPGQASPTSSGNCQDSVKILTPSPANSASVEHVCTRGSRLKVTDKDQSLVAVCRCPENGNKPDAAVPDGGAPEEKK